MRNSHSPPSTSQWRPLSQPSPLLAEIRAISRDRDRVLIAQHARENRLRAITDAYHQVPLHLFSSLDRDITLDFITDYKPPEQAARTSRPSRSLSRMDRFCRRHGYSGRTDMLLLAERMLNTHLRFYDKRLSELLEQHPDTAIFTSFPASVTPLPGSCYRRWAKTVTGYPHPAHCSPSLDLHQ